MYMHTSDIPVVELLGIKALMIPFRTVADNSGRDSPLGFFDQILLKMNSGSLVLRPFQRSV